MEDFGIIIACCSADYSLAKGCCASIRYFLGDVPICLLIDGNFSVSAKENAWGIQSINRNQISEKFLREKSFGWGKTKMIGFWASPWKHFLMLDADTVVWGNILQYANFQEADIIFDAPVKTHTNQQITKYFFDIDGVEKYFPQFPWYRYRNDYACTGAFFGTRGIFTLQEYEEILDFTEKHPGIFKYGEMGFLNFMIFRAAWEGRIRLKQEAIQFLVADFNREEVKNNFPVKETGPVWPPEEYTTVIHWCGPKPSLNNRKVYSKPMNFFRRKFLKEVQGLSGINREIALYLEEWHRFINIYQGKIGRLGTKLQQLQQPNYNLETLEMESGS